MYLILPLNFTLDENTPKFNRKYNKDEFKLLAQKTNKRIIENKLKINIFQNKDYLVSKIKNPMVLSIGMLNEIIVQNNKVFCGIDIVDHNYLHRQNTKISFIARTKNDPINDISNLILEEFLGFYLEVV